MSVEQGRKAFVLRNTPPNKRPIDNDEIKSSGIARGRALFRARHGDRAERAAAEEAVALARAVEDPDGPPPAA